MTMPAAGIPPLDAGLAARFWQFIADARAENAAAAADGPEERMYACLLLGMWEYTWSLCYRLASGEDTDASALAAEAMLSAYVEDQRRLYGSLAATPGTAGGPAPLSGSGPPGAAP